MAFGRRTFGADTAQPRRMDCNHVRRCTETSDADMMMGWFWVWSVLVLIGLGLLGYLAWRLAQGRGTGSAVGRSTAREILDERYARGEIDSEEYRQRRAELQ
jgi:putative membrane protein